MFLVGCFSRQPWHLMEPIPSSQKPCPVDKLIQPCLCLGLLVSIPSAHWEGSPALSPLCRCWNAQSYPQQSCPRSPPPRHWLGLQCAHWPQMLGPEPCPWCQANADGGPTHWTPPFSYPSSQTKPSFTLPHWSASRK